MSEQQVSGWRRDLRTAVFISAPFWVFALLGFYPANHAGHGGLAFMLLYALILLPGTLLAVALSREGGSTPWLLGLTAILIGQFGAIYVLVRLWSWLRSIRSKNAQR